MNHKNNIVYEKKKFFLTTTNSSEVYRFILYFPNDVHKLFNIKIYTENEITLNCGTRFNNIKIPGKRINNYQYFEFKPSLFEPFYKSNFPHLGNQNFNYIIPINDIVISSKYPIPEEIIKYEYCFNNERKEIAHINIFHSSPFKYFGYPICNITANGDFSLYNPLCDELFYSINNKIEFYKKYTDFDEKTFNEISELFKMDMLIDCLNNKDKNCISNNVIGLYFNNKSSIRNLTYCIEYYKFWYRTNAGEIKEYLIANNEEPSQEIINYFISNNL